MHHPYILPFKLFVNYPMNLEKKMEPYIDVKIAESSGNE